METEIKARGSENMKIWGKITDGQQMEETQKVQLGR